MLRARRATTETRRIFKRKLVFSIVLRSLPLLIQCNELIVIRTAKPDNDFYGASNILCTRLRVHADARAMVVLNL